MKRRLPFGITLVEAAILGSVLGILFAVVLPTYFHYAKRARISEGIEMAEEAMRLVSTNAAKGNIVFNQGWKVTDANSQAQDQCEGLSGPCTFGSVKTPLTDNVRSISVTGVNGMVTISYQARAAGEAGQTLMLWPTSSGAPLAVGTVPQEKITWTCFAAQKPLSLGAQSEAAPTLPRGLAPEQCR